MDGAKLILNQPVLEASALERLGNLENVSEKRKKQLAGDFESILVNKLLDAMENTIGQWGFEKDGASRQVSGLFSLYLSEHIAKNGGLGLWPEIYESMFASEG
ncbi:MAG: hypothetical protein DRP65_03435 [Planctomycetota bacterium]|nr:MAG: hypothetical protein DRP65_03435 [Planctomycetota bacterium]